MAAECLCLWAGVKAARP